jgi:hypothetical protein
MMVTEEDYAKRLARETAAFQPMVSAALELANKMGISNGAIVVALLRATVALSLGICDYDEAETRNWLAEGMDIAFGDILEGLERSRAQGVREGLPVPPGMDAASAAYKAKVAANG